jgi:signal transduction histidine kinase/PAS domain-containing protein
MPVKTQITPAQATSDQLVHEIADLRHRMAEAEDILQAIRNDEVDALVVTLPDGERVFALESADDADRQMVEQMREGAATISANGIVLFANQQFARLLDCPLDAIIAQPISRCVAPDEWPRLALILGDPAGGRLISSVHLGDRRRVPVLFSASQMRRAESPVTLLLVTDLTYEKQADRVARLLQLASRLSVPLDVAQAAEAIVNGALQVFEAAAGFVAVPAADGAGLRLLHTVGYSFERGLPASVLPLQANLAAAEAARTREVVSAESASERQQRFPDWQALAAEVEPGAVLAVPLLLPERFVGVLQVSFAGSRPFEPDDRDFALTVAQQCAQALERASLYSELELRVKGRTAELSAANRSLGGANERLTQEIAERRAVQRQLERSREEERTRVARELHDELGGALTALKMDISLVLKDAELSQPARQQLAKVVTMVDSTIVSMRRLATELRPHLLDDFGLLPAMESYFQEFIRRVGIAGEFTSEVNELELNGESATAYFRIFQESLTNIARHAEASQVTVRIERTAEAVKLHVIDNGRGMRLEDSAARGHLGLTGMQERASMIGAALEVNSAPGKGTTVLLRMPFEPAS